MKAALSAVLAVCAVFVGVVAASAATPDLLGGTLSAYPDHVTLVSTSTIPASVQMNVTGTFTLTPDTFVISPGETVTMQVSGVPTGRVSASMHAMTVVSGDAASVTLDVAFPRPYVPGVPWGLFGAVALAAVTLLLVIRRLRPWRWRLVRT